MLGPLVHLLLTDPIAVLVAAAVMIAIVTALSVWAAKVNGAAKARKEQAPEYHEY